MYDRRPCVGFWRLCSFAVTQIRNLHRNDQRTIYFNAFTFSDTSASKYISVQLHYTFSNAVFAQRKALNLLIGVENNFFLRMEFVKKLFDIRAVPPVSYFFRRFFSFFSLFLEQTDTPAPLSGKLQNSCDTGEIRIHIMPGSITFPTIYLKGEFSVRKFG